MPGRSGRRRSRGRRIGAGRRLAAVGRPDRLLDSWVLVGPPVALALDETRLAAEPSASNVTPPPWRIDGAAGRRRGLVGDEGQGDRDARRGRVPVPAAAPAAVDVCAVWVAVAENAPPTKSGSFAASGVPTWAAVVLFTTEMPTEGLIDADPPDEPETAFVLTVSVEPAVNVRSWAPVNCAVFWRSASVVLLAMVSATAAPTPRAPPPHAPGEPDRRLGRRGLGGAVLRIERHIAGRGNGRARRDRCLAGVGHDVQGQRAGDSDIRAGRARGRRCRGRQHVGVSGRRRGSGRLRR